MRFSSFPLFIRLFAHHAGDLLCRSSSVAEPGAAADQPGVLRLGEPVYISIMVLSILIDYTHGLLVEKYRSRDKLARWFVAESVLLNLGLLGFFKYWDFFAANLSLIPGVSIPHPGTASAHRHFLFTFQTMSYTIDVYRQDAPAQRNMVSFGAYVAMFPQLVAGPIVRYKDVAAELVHRTNTASAFAAGARRFTVALGKKCCWPTASVHCGTRSWRRSLPGRLTVVGGWGIAAFGFQIYFDFSGYSDMAIGMGQMLGFHFPENFNYPYTAASVTEFWRRWHISLTTWFREYLYIPLGGSRKGTWGRCGISSLSGSAPASGTGRAGISSSGVCTSLCGSCWKSICCGTSSKAAIVAAAFLHACGGVRGAGACSPWRTSPSAPGISKPASAAERCGVPIGRLLPDCLRPDAAAFNGWLHPSAVKKGLGPAAGADEDLLGPLLMRRGW